VIVTGFRSFTSVWGLGVPLELDPTSCVTAQDVLKTLGFTKFEKGSKIVILHPEGKAMRQIPLDYSKVQRKKSCLRRGDILLMP
jgi:hypothetical protein